VVATNPSRELDEMPSGKDRRLVEKKEKGPTRGGYDAAREKQGGSPGSVGDGVAGEGDWVGEAESHIARCSDCMFAGCGQAW